MSRLGSLGVLAAPELRLRWEARLGDHLIDAAFSPDGRWLAAAEIGGPIAVFDAEHGEVRLRLAGHEGGVFSLSWRADSHMLASGGQDGKLRLWSMPDGRLVTALDAGAPWVEYVRFAASGTSVVSAAGRKLRLWDSASATLLQSYADHPSTISDVQWQPGEPYFTSACYGQVATFRMDTLGPLKQFQWKGSILRLAWSPDSNFIATGNQDASVHFWYRKSGRELEMSGYEQKVRELSWDHSSRYLATGGSNTVIVWDCSGKGPAGSKPIPLEAHVRPVSALQYQCRGALLASGGRDGLVHLWNPKKSDRPLRQSMLEGEVTGLCCRADDRLLAAVSSQGHVRVFELAE